MRGAWWRSGRNSWPSATRVAKSSTFIYCPCTPGFQNNIFQDLSKNILRQIPGYSSTNPEKVVVDFSGQQHFSGFDEYSSTNPEKCCLPWYPGNFGPYQGTRVTSASSSIPGQCRILPGDLGLQLHFQHLNTRQFQVHYGQQMQVVRVYPGTCIRGDENLIFASFIFNISTHVKQWHNELPTMSNRPSLLTNFCSINQQYKDFDVVDPKNVVARVWHGRTNVWRGNYSALPALRSSGTSKTDRPTLRLQ